MLDYADFYNNVIVSAQEVADKALLQARQVDVPQLELRGESLHKSVTHL